MRLNGVKADKCWSKSVWAVLTAQPVLLEYRQVLHKSLRFSWMSEGGSLTVIEKHVVSTINELVMKSYLVWYTSRVFTYWNQVFFCSDNFLMIQQAEVFLHLRPLGDFFTWLVPSVGLFLDWNMFKMKQSTGFTLHLWERELLWVWLESSLGLGGTKQAKLVLSVWP